VTAAGDGELVGGSPWGRRAIIATVVVYAGALVLAPIVALVTGAFAEGLQGVLDTLKDPDVQSAFALTIEIALVVVAVHAVFGTITAWVLVRDSFRGKGILNALIDLPFAVSPVVVGYMLLLVFGRQGLLAPLLERLDVKVAFAVPGLVLATLFVTLPFMVRELAPMLEAFGVEHENAAATLGADGWTVFRRVTFPAIRWAFVYGMILTAARALGEFGAVAVVGGGVQGSTETATLYIYRALDERQYVSAYSVALILGAVALSIVVATEALRERMER
jgi:sulfate transport system permease protein